MMGSADMSNGYLRFEVKVGRMLCANTALPHSEGSRADCIVQIRCGQRLEMNRMSYYMWLRS